MKPARLPKLVGLVASAPGAGKDTFFSNLKASGFPVENIKFATKLEQEVYAQFRGSNERDLAWIRNDPTAKDQPLYMLSVSAIDAGFGNRGYKTWLREELGFKGLDDPRSMRWHLIQYGTGYIRKYLGKDSYWLDQGMKAAGRLTHTTDHTAVITDVRFHNEAQAIREAGGLLVFLESPWNTNANGGIADGLIKPEECHLRILNEHGNPMGAVDNFLNFLEKGPYND